MDRVIRHLLNNWGPDVTFHFNLSPVSDPFIDESWTVTLIDSGTDSGCFSRLISLLLQNKDAFINMILFAQCCVPEPCSLTLHFCFLNEIYFPFSSLPAPQINLDLTLRLR